ncbi:site-specific integrase [Spongiactinospora sp. TRM90649]|uniref:tyrosine-type recombinase/integrase n=1 Tax=Spongiactinospora sp. TRM90649 TaxID=3031114 RepID=UPI0023FA3070|nr:site-specific integrase [Spongiactinospora sp. TRM90649]MDF5758555.1 site-specific integrase [Spongiactinospora sp. TRM90649]
MARPIKMCNCRDEITSKKLGQKCPLLSKRDHGAWWFRYEAPPGSDGKRRRPWAGPYPNKTLAEKDMPRLQADAGSGKPIPDRKVKVGPYLRRWIAGKQSLAASTRGTYTEHIDLYLEPGLGHLHMTDLREYHLTELYAAMTQINRPVDGEPTELLRRLLSARAVATWTRDGEEEPGLWQRRAIGPTTIRRVHATLSSALTTARRQGLIQHDPSKNVELAPARRRRPLVWTAERVRHWEKAGGWGDKKKGIEVAPRPGPVMVWTPAQAGAMLDWLEDVGDRLYPLYHLVMTRGLRRGEAGRLEWSDTDLDGAHTISVLEDEDAEAEQGIKSDSSRRVVLLDKTNVLLLKAWRTRQKTEQLAAGAAWVDSGRVFTTKTGEPLDLDYLTDRWQRLVRWAKQPPVRLHDLRHCAATLMLAAGVDMKVVSATLGHRQFWFTADTYASVVPELAEAAAEAAVSIIPRAARRS